MQIFWTFKLSVVVSLSYIFMYLLCINFTIWTLITGQVYIIYVKWGRWLQAPYVKLKIFFHSFQNFYETLLLGTRVQSKPFFIVILLLVGMLPGIGVHSLLEIFSGLKIAQKNTSLDHILSLEIDSNIFTKPCYGVRFLNNYIGFVMGFCCFSSIAFFSAPDISCFICWAVCKFSFARKNV